MTCPDCEGDSYTLDDNDDRVDCTTCDATGEVDDPICDECNGSGEGYADGTRCRKCKGWGALRVREDEEFEYE